MKWPIMFRMDHEAIVNALALNIELSHRLIETQRDRLADQVLQITKLTDLLTNQNVIITPKSDEKQPKSPNQMPSGRGGWRIRASTASSATVPVPGDSAKALEERVEKQGGKV